MTTTTTTGTKIRFATTKRSNRTIRQDQVACFVCGQPTKSLNVVRVHDGGAIAVTEQEAETLNAAGLEGADMGLQTIGSDCLKKRPELRPYVTKEEA